MARPLMTDQRGVALLVVLSVIAVLTALAAELNTREVAQMDAAAWNRDRVRLQGMTSAAVQAGMALLIADRIETETDSVQEDWADPAVLEGLVEGLGYTEGILTLKIIDELGKLQVNALIQEYPGHAVNAVQRGIWENLLGFVISHDKSEDARDPAEIINAIIDWLDAGDDDRITGISGAESDYYASLDPPYACANGAVRHLSTLYRIKGVTPDLFNPTGILSDLLGEEMAALMEMPALSDYLTVWGEEPLKAGGGYRFDGRVNINTADPAVIAAILPFGKEDAAAALADYRIARQEAGGAFVNALGNGWYKAEADLTTREAEQTEAKIRYASDVFRIEAVAGWDQTGIKESVIIKRETDKDGKWVCRMLSRTLERADAPAPPDETALP